MQIKTILNRIHAHIAITVLSLLLERVIEHAAEDTWRNICDDLKQVQLAQLLSPNGPSGRWLTPVLKRLSD